MAVIRLDFYLAAIEVSQAQFTAAMGVENPSGFKQLRVACAVQPCPVPSDRNRFLL